jgi:glycosyltransferase involved in cell wall biosynthesis
MPDPVLSVVLPTYNCERYIAECLESILSQTFRDFEVLVIDDCSTDSTVAIVEGFGDCRIRLLQKPLHSGYTRSLNLGIDCARGEFLARIDGDDICLPTRFEEQIDYLRSNPDVALCGTACISNGEKVLRQPETHEAIRVKIFFSSPFFHPTVMGKTSLFLDCRYDPDFEPAEDYELWSRIVLKYRTANLPNPLLAYRIHEGQVSIRRQALQLSQSHRVRDLLFSQLCAGIFPPAIDKRISLNSSSADRKTSFLTSLERLEVLTNANDTRDFLNKSLLALRISYEKTDIVAQYLWQGEENIIFRMFDASRHVSLLTFLRALKHLYRQMLTICTRRLGSWSN